MTLTEATEYMAKVYLENGWISEEQLKKVKRESLAYALGIIALTVLVGVLFFILSSPQSG